jgi:hypothetical protein
MQVFALQDQRDGLIMIFCDDVLDVAVKGRHARWAARSRGTEQLRIVCRTASTASRSTSSTGKTANPSPFYKGHARLEPPAAIRITLPPTGHRAAGEGGGNALRDRREEVAGQVEAAEVTALRTCQLR